MAHKDRPNDSHLRSRNLLIASFDLEATTGAETQEVSVKLPPGTTTVKIAYEIQGDGTNVSFEVSGKPSQASTYIEVMDINTSTAKTLTLHGSDVDKWEDWKVVKSAQAGTWDDAGGNTLKVWIIT